MSPRRGLDSGVTEGGRYAWGWEVQESSPSAAWEASPLPGRWQAGQKPHRRRKVQGDEVPQAMQRAMGRARAGPRSDFPPITDTTSLLS